MTNTFLPLLQAPSNPEGTSRQVGSSTVINISSLLGSCEGSGRFTTTSYQCSKVAVNMLTKCQAAASPTIKFIAIHPGWVSRFIMRMHIPENNNQNNFPALELKLFPFTGSN